MTANRPQFHFSPRQGWINDPNGLVRVDGVYHIFYQANPNGLVHGPMHWGHASSSDLVTWDEHPIALYPDAGGQCFSGSAISAREGHVASELAADDGVLMFYTAHRDRDGAPPIEEQCVAIADRAMTTFRKYQGNPVIANPGPQDFRDPKVVWHDATQRWIMVVTHGQAIGFYSSADALAWQFESAFGIDQGRHGSGPWECPDLFPMTVEGTDETAWILVVGLGGGHISGGSGTQFFVGDFDGRTFTNRSAAEVELFMDLGRDYYATQTFSGLGGEAPLALAWMSNWTYANQTPADGFRGSMTLPRRLRLVVTAHGPRLVQTVDPIIARRFTHHRLDARSQTFRPASGTYCLDLEWLATVGQRLAIALFGEAAPILVVSRASEKLYQVAFKRAEHAVIPTERRFFTDHSFEIEASSAFELTIFVDNGLVEIGCCSGRQWISNIHFPTDAAGAVTIEVG